MPLLSLYRAPWKERTARTYAGEPPLRAELFSLEQLERHARALAAEHKLAPRECADRLLARLADNEAKLRAFNRTTPDAHARRRITPAAEWLLDNFYLIEEQIQMARRHLPRGYSRELPCLRSGPGAGLPRVHALILELIAHVDARIDAAALGAFIAAYQTAGPLKLGELWAIPIMLRLGLIENLQRITTRLTQARHERDVADAWVDRLQEMGEKNPANLVVVVADMARGGLPLTSPFVAEFCYRLSRQSPLLHLARTWLEQKLAEQGLSIEQLIHQESQSQAADQVSVSQSIASLRFLSAMDWKEFVETLSPVEEILRSDPAEEYGRMDFATRDRYRHAVEFLARHSRVPEVEVARRAIRLAAESAAGERREVRTAHVGYHLIDAGRAGLARELGVRWPWRSRLERAIQRFPLVFYAGGIAAFSILATLAFLQQARAFEIAGGRLILFTALFFACVSQLGVGLANWLAILLMKPRLLPRLDFSQGIPPGCRTMVVVPTLLTSPEGVDGLIETLEIHHLANRDQHLHFALLTDFADADAATLPGDETLLERARAGIGMLNRRYSLAGDNLFYLFHRPRRWNAAEGRWMGRERKRGKLEEFNALLRGGAAGCFSEIVGDRALLPAIRYVITLDTDTQLPRETARQLVGTLAHRLNRPVFDPARGIVTEGYAILQPRVGVSLPAARHSWFARLFAGEPGIDPYTREVSDVYQDVFQEGSFIGKGIYDVDAFQRALEGRFPDNTVLSHDLLEGCHARAALVCDIELYEDHPSHYHVDVARRHRWIRGDWQIMPWLLPRVPGAGAKRLENPISGLSRWKLFDNLRRSLMPVALTLLLVGSWLGMTEFDGGGLLVVLGIIAAPGLLAVLTDTLRWPADLPWKMHLRAVLAGAARQLGQVFLALAFLPYEAGISLDAIGRALWRQFATRRHLLEWTTASEAGRNVRAGLGDFYAIMLLAPGVALATGLGLTVLQPGRLGAALPLLGLWAAAPGIAWWISRPIAAPAAELTAEQIGFLGHLSRRTWHFFETFVTAQENWLPPDNFQEVPVPTIASRTSPTNIGLLLLANLAARDFGYLPAAELIRRTQDTLATLRRLERHRGHFFNWYDTRTLEPLPPRYVSSVDSGNLAGHLLTLATGLREETEAGIFRSQIMDGLRDTVGVLRQLVPKHAGLQQLEEELSRPAEDMRAAFATLHAARTQATAIARSLPDASAEIRDWTQTLERNCEEHLADLVFLAPWLEKADAEPAVAGVPTLRELAGLGGRPSLSEAVRRARERVDLLESLAAECETLAMMDFGFLYDPEKKLFTIGYNVTDARADSSCYDLLASEARLCSYLAIALGQVEQEHWFALNRRLVATRGEPMLLSWSGSMFEYLMPLLVMPNFENTLLDHSCRAAVREQIEYGKAHGVPWGISESGYSRTDARLNYQYRAFGVPGLGLKRGLAEDLVIAPYATVMALLVAPRESCENLQRLALEERSGPYGFYEAVDYTRSRLPPDETAVLVRSFMSHHQGMSLLALVHLLRDAPMQRRFLACPLLKATELLLQERVPRTAANVFEEDVALEVTPRPAHEAENTMRVFTHPAPPTPEVHLLSNGAYHVAITSAGGGVSRWRDLALTRWREDATRDCWGTFIYLRDLATGEFWSAAHQPALRPTRNYEAIFSQGRAEFRQRPPGLEVHTEIAVSPEDDVELRRVTLVNRSPSTRIVELTSYAEVVLAPAAADAAHPAFGNLFVQTEFLPKSPALLCTRRSGAADKKSPWLLHLVSSEGGVAGEVSAETDRFRFLGRGGTPANPAALQGRGAPLSNTAGSVLDPIVSLRCPVTLRPNETVVVDYVLGATESREGALALVEKYRSPRMVDRAFELAWTHGQVTLRHLNATESEAQLYGRLAGALLYADPARRAGPAILRQNRRGQSGLWSYGISGDAPLVLLRISDAARLGIVRQLIQAHSYWRLKGLTVELLIVDEDVSVYRQSLHEQIIGLIASGIEAQMLDKPGGIFVRRLEQIPSDDRGLLQAAARVVLDDEHGSLADQLGRWSGLEPLIPALIPSRSLTADPARAVAPRELIFPNGLGGFTRDAHEYVITLEPGRMTPAPWINVLANPAFGTVISESGGSYTWLQNAHEFRLTPWHNDPVQDPTGEAFYLRDEHTGQVWSPTPLPARGSTPYVIRHGFGYTVFEHAEHGLISELSVYVAMDAPVKFVVWKVRNASGRPRRLSATGYWEWVLGDLRAKNLLHVQTEVDLETGAVLARNGYNTDFPNRVVFVDVNDPARTLTGDRREFLGRNGTLAQPAALKRVRLSGRVGAGLDPCAALQVAFDLADGQEREICFRLGAAGTLGEAKELIRRFRRPDAVRGALEGVWSHWNRVLGAVQVETPDPAVNALANGWLLYQTLGCRLWGRTGFYQSGGAYGFRDQLQDVMALVHAEPSLTREHLLRAAAHQFREGDVQHWWHPPGGRGVRTHFSDDFLWLPYVTCRYVDCVADTGVLDEKIPFLEGRPVKLEEEAYYDLPNRSEETTTLYRHCVRAIERGLKFGAHGLPLIGCGDWNDGMNRVGHHGRGESVWLGFFLYDVLIRFASLARRQQDPVFAERCLTEAHRLQKSIEEQAWDGGWYRRAWFDNGDPLGSQANEECQIDSLPQSWAVISGAGEPERARQAMEAVDRRLVRRETKLIQLFDPPFQHSAADPGYIKGYIPGVRENGGQYTHGAIWTVMAFALRGDTERAWELFGMLNPILHATTPAEVAIYKVEPYVVAADVYAVPPHAGRGGWTWYTGSAGWMYRLLLETLLGVNLEGERLRLTPRLPKAWPGFRLNYRYRRTVYRIAITRLAPTITTVANELSLDGELLSEGTVPLQDDQREHTVELKLLR